MVAPPHFCAISLVFLAACAFISDREYAERLDGDGDGVPRPDDCDDDDRSVTNPTWYTDADGDGFGAGEPNESCPPAAGWSTEPGDCDDADERANPGASEVFEDGVDNDCDGAGAPFPASMDFLDAGGRISGEEGTDELGTQLMAGGDLTGDGVDDLVVGSGLAAGPGSIPSRLRTRAVTAARSRKGPSTSSRVH